jgi:prefoldin subunit 5
MSEEVERLQARIEQLSALLRELQNARPLLLYGDAWIERITQVLVEGETTGEAPPP